MESRSKDSKEIKQNSEKKKRIQKGERIQETRMGSLKEISGGRVLCQWQSRIRGRPFIFLFRFYSPLWARTNKNTDWSCGPLARPFARSLAPLTRSLAPHYSLRSRPPLRSLVRSLAHFAHSLARGTVNDEMAIYSVFLFLFWLTVWW